MCKQMQITFESGRENNYQTHQVPAQENQLGINSKLETNIKDLSFEILKKEFFTSTITIFFEVKRKQMLVISIQTLFDEFFLPLEGFSKERHKPY